MESLLDNILEGVLNEDNIDQVKLDSFDMKSSEPDLKSGDHNGSFFSDLNFDKSMTNLDQTLSASGIKPGDYSSQDFIISKKKNLGGPEPESSGDHSPSPMIVKNDRNQQKIKQVRKKSQSQKNNYPPNSSYTMRARGAKSTAQSQTKNNLSVGIK